MRGPQISEKRAYEVLELKPPVSKKELMTAFRKAALKHHPDRGGDAAKFREVTDAKDYILQNPFNGIIVEDEPPETENALLKQFLDLVNGRSRKIPTSQYDTVVRVIKMLWKSGLPLDVSIIEDEVLIQKKIKNGLDLISVDGFNVCVQIAIFINNYSSIDKFGIYKHSDDKIAVSMFLNNQ